MQINLISPINELGYGQVGRNILKALHNAGHEPALWLIGMGEAQQSDHALIAGCIKRCEEYNRQAPSVRIYHQFALAEHVGKGLHCGFPIFELDKFKSNEFHHMNNQDILFVPSKWAAAVCHANKITVPVHVVPFGVDRTIFKQEDIKSSKDNTTVFFNSGKWELRKSHDIILESFTMAFGTNDNVKLILNCNNPFIGDENKKWNDMYMNSPLGKAGKIQIIKNRLESQQELARLMALADCGVFPAKAEGWNLELLEMMGCGKHVIATNYSGHTEYANADNCMLIDCPRREPAYDGKWFLAESKEAGEWAEIGSDEVDQLISHMRSIHKRKQSGELSVNKSGIETAQQFSWENTVKTMVNVWQ